eukprot:m.228034 g.228034  ORF g.228034 m.228034 type:complete len:575 (+) comp18824_c0_seq2:214-1938(+)
MGGCASKQKEQRYDDPEKQEPEASPSPSAEADADGAASSSVSPPPPPPPPPGAAVPTGAGSLPPPPPPPPSGGGGGPPPPPPPPNTAITRIQATFRGYAARKRMHLEQRQLEFLRCRIRLLVHRIRKRRRIDLSTATAVASLHGIDWSQAEKLQRSVSGRSSGVFFVAFPGNQVLIVKPDPEIAAAVLGATLAEFLGVRVPATRMVYTDEEEGQRICECLGALDESKPASEQLHLRMTLQDMPAVLLMEFVAGASLEDLAFSKTPEQRKAWCEAVFGGEDDLTEDGERRLREIGHILAYDALVHNYDRLPCLWDNEGNAGNLMFNKSGDPVAIDSLVSCFDPEVGKVAFKAYLGRVRELLETIADDPGSEHPRVMRIRNMLLKGRGTEADESYCPPMLYDIGEDGVVEIQAGLLECAERFDVLNLEVLSAMCAGPLAELEAKATKFKSLGFEKIRLEFLAAVSDIFRRKGVPDKKVLEAEVMEAKMKNKLPTYRVVPYGKNDRNMMIICGDVSETVYTPGQEVKPMLSQQWKAAALKSMTLKDAGLRDGQSKLFGVLQEIAARHGLTPSATLPA